MKSVDSSVVVCTYNRADSLSATLKSLAQQRYTIGSLEILVVDNNSDDHTKQVFDAIAERSPVRMRYLFEPIQGVSQARNTGIAASNTDLVLFIDDDAYPIRSDWAEKLAGAFDDAKVGAAGGDALPAWPPSGRPEWLHDRLLSYIGIVEHGHTSPTTLHYPHYPYGVNIAFRRTVLDQIGEFSTYLGRHGKTLLSGEETELCQKVEKSGHKVIYVPSAAVTHNMAPSRLQKLWFYQRAEGQGTTKAALEIANASSIEWLYRVTLRIGILLCAKLGATLSGLLGLSGWAVVLRCRALMSRSYLAFAFGKN